MSCYHGVTDCALSNTNFSAVKTLLLTVFNVRSVNGWLLGMKQC